MPNTLLGSIDASGLDKGYGGYDQSFAQYTDANGNVYTPTYGGELNTPQTYASTVNVGGDTVNVQYDANGNLVSATGQPYTENGKQYVNDYNASGEATKREYTQPGFFSDILDAAKFLGPAVLGGWLAGGGASGLFSDSAALQAAADADIAGGMVPEFGTNAAYDAFMAGAMTPEAATAIETMINNAAVDPGFENMSYNWTPNGADVFTGGPDVVTTPTTTTPTTVTTTPTPVTPPTVTTPTVTTPTVTPPTVTTPTTVIPSVITKLLPGLLTAGTVNKVITPTTKTTTTTPLTTGITPTPSNNQDYYNAIQQYYNAYMPNAPRDVTTPLQQWYSSKYGA